MNSFRFSSPEDEAFLAGDRTRRFEKHPDPFEG